MYSNFGAICTLYGFTLFRADRWPHHGFNFCADMPSYLWTLCVADRIPHPSAEWSPFQPTEQSADAKTVG
jgi:hypothetical protein